MEPVLSFLLLLPTAWRSEQKAAHYVEEKTWKICVQVLTDTHWRSYTTLVSVHFLTGSLHKSWGRFAHHRRGQTGMPWHAPHHSRPLAVQCSTHCPHSTHEAPGLQPGLLLHWFSSHCLAVSCNLPPTSL